MSIRFLCPECGKKLEIDDRHAGRTVECPRCGLPMIVPELAAEEYLPEESLPEDESAQRPSLSDEDAMPEDEASPIEAELQPTSPAAEEPAWASMPRRSPSRPRPGKQPKYKEAEAETPLVPPMMKIDFEDLIDMTAMVDIVFFLLIFFLVTSMNALDSTIPLPAPTPQAGTSGGAGSTPTSVDGEDSSITVNIDRNDTIRIDGVEVTGQRDLLFKLRDLKNGPGRPEKLLVVGSSDASHGVAVMVLDAGHEVGMESVQLAVRDDNE